MSNKTIADVTQEEWAKLAEAAIGLLGCARFLFWLSGQDKQEDQSCQESMEEAAKALASIGLPQLSTDEFLEKIEEMLNGDPAKFAADLKRKGVL